MNDLNSVFIVGRVAADPQVRSAKSGMKVLSLRIANHHYSFDEEKKEYAEETGFFNVVMFGRQAEKWGASLKKGQRIGVNGRLSQDNWESKEGEKKTRDSIVAYAVQLLDVTTPAA
jgi:single-strand DNA-binding protein